MSGSRAPATHDQFLALAATSIDFRLSPQEELRLRDHLAQCPACAHAAAALRQDAAALSRQPRDNTPWAVQDAVLRAASARRATGRSPGRPSIGPMLGLALLIVALAGSVFVAGSVLDTRVPPGPDATQPVTVLRPSQAPRRTTEPRETPEPRTPRPAQARASWTALGDLTDQFGAGEVTLIAASPEGGYLAFGLDPTSTTPIVWSSTNGRRWREIDRPADTFRSGAPTGAAPGGDGLVVVGRNVQTRGTQKAMWSTADGRSWRQLPDISSQIATRQGSIQITAGPLGLVAWLDGGRAWWSSDGMDWRRTQDLPSGVTDVVVGENEVIAIGRRGERVWVARSADGLAWPTSSQSEPDGQEPTNVTPGLERAAGLPTLAWAGRDRFQPAREGRWEPAATGRLPMPLAPRQVLGGPRGLSRDRGHRSRIRAPPRVDLGWRRGVGTGRGFGRWLVTARWRGHRGHRRRRRRVADPGPPGHPLYRVAHRALTGLRSRPGLYAPVDATGAARAHRHDTVSAALVAFLAAIVAGGFGSMVGIGGGLIIVPVLTALLGYDIKVAIAASLVGVIATSVGASGRYLGTGIADRRLGAVLLVATAIGGLTGGLTNQLLDGRVLAFLFAILLALVAVQMARQLRTAAHPTATEGAEAEGFDSHYLEPSSGELVPYRARNIGLGTAVSFGAGNVSGLLGVGGGVINVPTMTVLMGVPIRVATTTSTWMLGATAATSAMIGAASGVLDPLLAAPVALGVFLGARVGARIAMGLSQTTLRLIFIGVAVVFAVQMLTRALGL